MVFFSKKGQSLIEVILAMTIFALSAVALIALSGGGFAGLEQGGEQTQAEALAQEGLAAVRAIQDRAWNEFDYAQSDVTTTVDGWSFQGEGTSETIGQYTRTITFEDVCRDVHNNIVNCPGDHVDIYSKKALVLVSWEIRPGLTNEVRKVMYLTNWDSYEWIEDTTAEFSDGTLNAVEVSNTLGDGDGAVVLEYTPGGGDSPWDCIEPVASFDMAGVDDATTIASTDTHIFVGRGTMLHAYSFTAPTTLVETSSIDLGNTIHEIAISGNYAYIAKAQNDELSVVNISNPGAITEVATYDIVGAALDAYDIYIDGNVAYVVTEQNGAGAEFFILNILNPLAIDLVDPASLYDVDKNILGVSVDGDYAYLATEGDTEFIVLDISDVANISAVGGIDFPGWVKLSDIVLKDTHIFASADNWTGNMYSIDISNPDNPVLDDTFSYGGGTTNFDRLTVLGDYIFSAQAKWDEEFVMFGIDDPTNVLEHTVFDYDGASSVIHQGSILGSYFFVVSEGDDNEIGWYKEVGCACVDIGEDTQAEWDAGDYTNTEFSVDHLQLDNTGLTNNSGIFTSQVIDTNKLIDWQTFSWMSAFPYGKELPNDEGIEIDYTDGAIDMSGNVLLMHLNGNLDDDSGQGHSCTNNGAAITNNGKYNSAYTFTDDYISCVSSAALDLTDTLSIEFWINGDYSGQPDILTKGAYDESYSVWIDNSGQIVFQLNSDDFFSLNTIDNTRWHHVAVTYGAGLLHFYIDGVEDPNSYNVAGPIDIIPDDLTLSSNSQWALDGATLDEVAIYNRVLSAEEISDRYIRGAANLTHQIRSCDDELCAGENFIGPDGTNSTYFSELLNSTLTTPSVTVSGTIAQSKYIQYQTTFESIDQMTNPKLYSVTIGEGCGNIATVAESIIDDTTDEFNTGTYNDTEWNGTNVLLNATGLVNGTGEYISEVFNVTSTATWQDFSWVPNEPYGIALPNNGATEVGYIQGNISMSNNIFLLHLDEASGNVLDTSGNGNDGVATGLSYEISGRYDTAVRLEGGSDAITIADNASLDISDDITIEMWIKDSADSSSELTIEQSLLGSLEYDTSQSYYPKIINISGDVYAVVYRGPGNDGWMKTFSVDASGQNIVSLFSKEFDTSYGTTPTIVQVNGSIYAVVYAGLGSDGWIKTFDIQANGQIGNQIDSLEYDNKNGLSPSVLAVDADTFVISYRGDSSDGWFATVDISATGNISNNYIDRYEFDNTDCFETDLIEVGNNIFAVVYSGVDSDGFIKTIEIEDNGNIVGSIIDTFEYNTSQGRYPDIIAISGDVYAISHQGSGSDGFIKTVTIDVNGQIGAEIDSLEFDTDNTIMSSLVHMSDNNYAVFYTGNNNNGYLKVVEIENNGQIGNAVVDSYQFISNGRYPYMLSLGNGLLLGAYTDVVNHGWVSTFSFGGGDVHIAIGKNNSYGFSLSSADVSAFINDSVVSSTLSAGWNHIVLTYNKDEVADQQKLYINGVEVATGTYTQNIAVNNEDFVVGNGVVATFDEMALYSRVLSAQEILDRYRRGILNITYQVRSCNDVLCVGDAYTGSDGTGGTYFDQAGVVGVPSYNLAITDGQYFQYRAVLSSEHATHTPQFSEVRVDYERPDVFIPPVGGGGGPASYALSGTYISSAYDMGANTRAIQGLTWEESFSNCIGCSIQLQIRTADTQGNLAAAPWSGINEAGTFYTEAIGSLVPTVYNGDRWIQYQAILHGDTVGTPILERVQVNYK
ncbi:hypothetical protein KKG22_03295 [Patescibacteria group bacterium]|nr:hypothetical protein [Patescibacteria group bacterium]MBU1721175.1 hypothetical protein [Patescibacteria group bacterium]MBU1900895.1 hypothetical protein [Patescibacteria group bacterium]